MSSRKNVKVKRYPEQGLVVTSWTVVPGQYYYDCKCCGFAQHEDLLEENDGNCTDCWIYCEEKPDEEIHRAIARDNHAI